MAFYAKKWSSKEDKILAELAQEGHPASTIKYVIKDICNSDRSESAIASRAKSKLFITLEYSKGKTLDDFPDEQAAQTYSGMPKQEDVTILLEAKEKHKIQEAPIYKIKDYLMKNGCTKFGELTELRAYLEEYGYITPIPKYGVNFRWDEEQDQFLLDALEKYGSALGSLTSIAREYNDAFGLARKDESIRGRLVKLKGAGVPLAPPREELSAPENAKWTRQQVQLVLDHKEENPDTIAQKLQDTFGVSRSAGVIMEVFSKLGSASPPLTEEELAQFRKRFSGGGITVKRSSKLFNTAF